MPIALFAYGTLEIPEVMSSVAGRLFLQQPACIADHARYCLRQRVYPGLRYEAGSITHGTLYTGLDGKTLKRLDAFESDIYIRETHVVATRAGELTRAEVYLIPPRHYGELTHKPWNPAAFKQRSLRHFLDGCDIEGIPRADSARIDGN